MGAMLLRNNDFWWIGGAVRGFGGAPCAPLTARGERRRAKGESRKAKGAASVGRHARSPEDRFSLGQGVLP